jgi:hypothetical protein
VTDDQHVKWGQFITLLACVICAGDFFGVRVSSFETNEAFSEGKKYEQSMWGNLHLLMSPK